MVIVFKSPIVCSPFQAPDCKRSALGLLGVPRLEALLAPGNLVVILAGTYISKYWETSSALGAKPRRARTRNRMAVSRMARVSSLGEQGKGS